MMVGAARARAGKRGRGRNVKKREPVVKKIKFFFLRTFSSCLVCFTRKDHKHERLYGHEEDGPGQVEPEHAVALRSGSHSTAGLEEKQAYANISHCSMCMRERDR